MDIAGCLPKGRLLAISGFLVLFGSCSVFAQNAGFSGQILDPQKAAVPDAELRVVNQKTAVERRTKTNESGFYDCTRAHFSLLLRSHWRS